MEDGSEAAAPDDGVAVAIVGAVDEAASDEAASDEPKTFVAAGVATNYLRAPTIVVRRKRRGRTVAPHGGSWKIAYADFVTAMMAFFLLMWLLSSTNQGDLQGIADYFNRPLQALFTQGPGATPATAPQSDAEAEARRRADDEAQLEGLKARLDALIVQDPKISAFKNQIKIDVTSEGLRIQIVDDRNRPMFDRGDAVLKDYTKAILDHIGGALNAVPNHVSIAGHTDSLSYSGPRDGYSNWELSSERANAARRELLAGGMNPSKILQVRGLADALPLYKDDTSNPANRRISIVVLNRQAEDNFRRDGEQPSIDVKALPAAEGTPATPAAEGTP